MVDWPLYGDREADVFSGSPGQSESGDCGLCLAVIGEVGALPWVGTSQRENLLS